MPDAWEIPEGRKVVTLVGRRRDWRLLREAERVETMAGNIVLTVGCIGVGAEQSEQDDHDEEQMLACIALHHDKIRMADEIVWATATGRDAGLHTAHDLALARDLDKPIRTYPTAPCGGPLPWCELGEPGCRGGHYPG